MEMNEDRGKKIKMNKPAITKKKKEKKKKKKNQQKKKKKVK